MSDRRTEEQNVIVVDIVGGPSPFLPAWAAAAVVDIAWRAVAWWQGARNG